MHDRQLKTKNAFVWKNGLTEQQEGQREVTYSDPFFLQVGETKAP